MRADCEGEAKAGLSAETAPGPQHAPPPGAAPGPQPARPPIGSLSGWSARSSLSSLGFWDFTSLVTPFSLCHWLLLVSLACWGSLWTPSLSTHFALSS